VAFFNSLLTLGKAGGCQLTFNIAEVCSLRHIWSNGKPFPEFPTAADVPASSLVLQDPK
jgi:hypothetical protein